MLKRFSEVAPTCFGPYLCPSSGGSWALLCAVTKLVSVDVRSLCVCAVCGHMSLPVVCMCVWSSCPGEIWSQNRHAAVCHYCQFVCVSGAPVRVRSGAVVGRCQVVWIRYLTTSNNHVRQPSTYAKPEAACAVLGSWWWAVCPPKHVELHLKRGIIKFWYTVASCSVFLCKNNTDNDLFQLTALVYNYRSYSIPQFLPVDNFHGFILIHTSAINQYGPWDKRLCCSTDSPLHVKSGFRMLTQS